MTEMEVEDRRETNRRRRLWWAIKNPGRWTRLRRWTRSPAIVTKGYLAFRDIVVLGFVGAIVIAGVTTVNALRREDCESGNRTRSNAAEVALADVDSDRKIWIAIDDLIDNGIPEPARTVIFNELQAREIQIALTYAEQSCPA